jgi:hypothetical protein
VPGAIDPLAVAEAAQLPESGSASEGVEAAGGPEPSVLAVEVGQLADHSAVDADTNNTAKFNANVGATTKPAEIDDAPLGVDEAGPPRDPGVVPDPSVASSEPLELAAPDEVVETVGPASPAGFERSAPVLEPAELRLSGGARSSVRPDPAGPPKIVWPQGFLDAQRPAAPKPDEPTRLEIPEPEIAGPSGVSR